MRNAVVFGWLSLAVLSATAGAQQTTIVPQVRTKPTADNKITSIELAAHFVTAIRVPEAVNSVVVGDPALFQVPTAQQLEQVLLSRNPNQIAQTSGAYTALYGPVPAPTAASPQVLNMVDMTDAAAQAAMKRAIEIDALADLELQAANQLNQSIQTAAPGSAPIIEAQADAWLIRANAYTQSATADLMRLRAVDLANASADIKMGATNTTNLRQALANLLQHQ